MQVRMGNETSAMPEPTRLRVMYVVGNSVIGGAENHVLTLAGALTQSGFAVSVVCPRPGPLVDALDGVCAQVQLVDMVRPAPNDEYEVSLEAVGRLVELMERWQPDVVHSHLYPAFVHASLAGRLAGAPALVSTAHTLIVRPGDAWVTRLTATRVIAVSQAAKRLLVEGGVSPRAIRVIPNGIESRYFEDESERARVERERLGIPDGVPVVGTIARLSEEKGHRELLHIARGVLDRCPDAVFLIVGTGPLADELHTQAEALKIADRVIFTGARRDVTTLNHLIDVFLLPSREEALPLAVLEAMAAARPIVASAVGGVPEVVVDGETGMLFAPNDRSGFVRAVAELIDDPNRRRQIGERGRRRASTRFRVDRMIGETVRYYRAILATRRPDLVTP
jgi:glycosyltransferase involved in cell wall biosynthesis